MVALAGSEVIMFCPKCNKEGVEPGDTFCRHCGFSLVTLTSVPERAVGIAKKKTVTVRNLDASKGLELFGAAIVVIVALIVFAVAPLMGWLTFGGSVLPWLSGALTLVGLVMIFIGFELRSAR